MKVNFELRLLNFSFNLEFIVLSVDKYAAIEKYVNSSIYNFGFYDLWFTLDLYILGPLKYFMKSGSIKSIETTNFLFLWVPFLILFFHVFVNHKLDLRFKYVLIAFLFLFSNFCLSMYNDIIYDTSPDYISTCNKLCETCLWSRCSILTNSKPKAINNNKSFYCLILILFGDISLNLGPIYNHHLQKL